MLIVIRKSKKSRLRPDIEGFKCQAEEFGGGIEEFTAKGQALKSQGNILFEGKIIPAGTWKVEGGRFTEVSTIQLSYHERLDFPKGPWD